MTRPSKEEVDSALLIAENYGGRSGTERVLATEVRALRNDLSKCGKENCMGYAVDGVRQWVSKERLEAVLAELEAAKKLLEVHGIEMIEPKDVRR